MTRFYNKFDVGDVHNIFKNKYLTYQKFIDFFKRKVIEVSTEKDRSEYDDFINKYRRFIVKPISASKGAGVHIVEINEEFDSNKRFEEASKVYV